MKRLIPILLLCLCSCTTITQYPDGSFSVSSFASKRTINTLRYSVSTNSVGQRVIQIDVEGYASDQQQVMTDLMDVAAKAMALYLKSQTGGVIP